MRNLENIFVPHDIALKLKEKGFNEPCLAIYNNSSMPFIAGNTPVFNDKTEDESIITSPIYEQVINWLDEKHKIRICLSTAKTSGKYRYDIIQFIEDKWQGDYNLSSFYTSTERNIKAINEAFELI